MKEKLLALGLTAEQVEEFMTSEVNNKFIPKARLDEVISERDNYKGQVTKITSELETVQKSKGDVEELKTKLNTLTEENTKISAEFEGKIKQMKVDTLVNDALRSAKAKDADIVKPLLNDFLKDFDGQNTEALNKKVAEITSNEKYGYLFEKAEAKNTSDSQKGWGFKGVAPTDSGKPGTTGDSDPFIDGFKSSI